MKYFDNLKRIAIIDLIHDVGKKTVLASNEFNEFNGFDCVFLSSYYHVSHKVFVSVSNEVRIS